MNRFHNVFFLPLYFIVISGHGQSYDFNYKRNLENESLGWNTIFILPEMYGKVQPSYNDIRIFGMTDDGDTVEAPYYVRENTTISKSTRVPFQIINRTKKGKDYFFTFTLTDTDENVNRIDLTFEERNFDWKVKLEGSQDGKNWFTILDDYRIVAIENEITEYQFTTLSMSSARYDYFRLVVKNPKSTPHLNKAEITRVELNPGRMADVRIDKMKTDTNDQNETIIDLELKHAVPVSSIFLAVNDTFDFYRPIRISCVTDSLETSAGWKFTTTTMTHGILSSFETNAFTFNPIITKKLSITIENHDNQILNIRDAGIKRNEVELITRITEPASYVIYYGSDNAPRPRYDIEMFKDQVPEDLNQINLMEEERIIEQPGEDRSLIRNKIWLWVAMGAVVLLLGTFTLRMMKEK